MSKFRIKMKLTGLELEIEGTRDEMPQISRNIGQQFAGLLQPAAGIVEGRVVSDTMRVIATQPAVVGGSAENAAEPKKRASQKRAAQKRRGAAQMASNGQAAPAVSVAIDFTHDSTRYGAPKQDWSSVQKSIWLLHVVEAQAGRRELTAHQIEATFNRHFREAKQIHIQNIARDLGKQRAKTKGAPVAEDTTITPSPWYLTEAGRHTAQSLVAQALAGAGAVDGAQDEEGQGLGE